MLEKNLYLFLSKPNNVLGVDEIRRILLNVFQLQIYNIKKNNRLFSMLLVIANDYNDQKIIVNVYKDSFLTTLWFGI
jgi:hypothetical protein